MTTTMAEDALDAVRTAIDGLDDLAAADLARCTSALVDAAGAAGAALFDRVDGQLEPLASAGWLPRRIGHLITRTFDTDASATDGPLVAAPVHCPQSVRLVLVADVGGDRERAVLVRSAAHQISMRLDLLDTHRRLRMAEIRSETLASATQALTRTLELQDVLAAILAQLRLVVPYDSASVQHLEGHHLQIIGGAGFPNLEQILGISFDMQASDNPNRLVVERREPMILGDAPSRYPAFRANPHMPAGICSWLGVPLEFGDRLLGMLSIDSRHYDFYDDEHARIAGAFAAQAAIAIENARLFGEMRRMAIHDSLTGLPNRRHVEEVGSEAVARARREGRFLAVLVFDLDRFKIVNDTHGHAVGDEVLCEIAHRVRDRLRPQDIVARFGGEEFVALLPDADDDVALVIAERLRAGVAEAPIPTAAGALPITISIGVCARSPVDMPLDELLLEADRALYDAKALGRNRVVAAQAATTVG